MMISNVCISNCFSEMGEILTRGCIWINVACRRYDLTEGLKKLQCRTLISVGENSPFHSEALHMCAKMDKKFNALVEVITFHFLKVDL